MWEVIRKNKIKSVIALFSMTVWYSMVYGFICMLIILSVFKDSANLAQNVNFFYASGVLVAFLIFLIQFLMLKDKPYKVGSCIIYPIGKDRYKQLYNIVEEIAIASGTGLSPQLYILNSDIPNAYACGFSAKKSCVVISKKLLEILSRDELQGVIAHEMSHIINKDTTYLLCSGALYSISAAFSASFLKGAKRGSRGAAGCLLLYCLSAFGQAICFILFMFISRKREYIADASASVYTRYPKGLADALLKLEYENDKDVFFDYDNSDSLLNASFLIPFIKLEDSIFSTHPSTQNRIKVLLNMETADYREYEKEFQRLNNQNLLPKSALENAKNIPIKNVKEVKIEPKIALACALGGAVKDKEQVQTIKNNKEILEQNIKKHREVEDMVRDLAGYIAIDCECGTKLKIPPVYKDKIVICPHCKKKHVI
ncbi:MAG: M48 family metalloprotease [Candidatus Gastranaerophilales bacterium]|nr:M48 family metalloprotease [Candidatus Gastranaerophilales bacterium]